MRDPTIHIKRSDLIKVISEMRITGRTLPSVIVDGIFNNCQQYQIRNRYQINGSAAIRKKVKRTIESENPIVQKFNVILDSTRRECGHKGISIIRVDHRDYLSLKEVAKIAYDFSEDFEIEPRSDGYKEFCKIGIEMMGRKYSLNKFKSYKEKIYFRFQNMVDVLQDEAPDKTLQFYYNWKECMLEYANFEYEIMSTEYDKYVNFVDARKKADKYQADYKEWVTAQFEGLVFLNAVPELSQLGSEKSLDRYERYVKNLDYDNNPDEEFTSDKEAEYFKALKNEE